MNFERSLVISIDKFVDSLIADSYYEWRRVFVPAEAIGHLKFKDVAVLYRDQLNHIINEISKLPSKAEKQKLDFRS